MDQGQEEDYLGYNILVGLGVEHETDAAVRLTGFPDRMEGCLQL